MSNMPKPLYRFSHYAVDASAHALWKDGVRVPIQEQPFQVLLALLERHGQVVSRETLRRRLWGTEIFVDFDQSLNSALRRLRIALDDNSRDPVFVETIPRVGFRFLYSFTVEEAPAAAAFGTGAPVAPVLAVGASEAVTVVRV